MRIHQLAPLSFAPRGWVAWVPASSAVLGCQTNSSGLVSGGGAGRDASGVATDGSAMVTGGTTSGLVEERRPQPAVRQRRAEG